MDMLKMTTRDGLQADVVCGRCGEDGQWDRVAGLPLCPGCEEQLALGEAPPLCLPTERRRCTACNQPGTVPFVTVPLNTPTAVAMDLCGEHLRALLGRRLGPFAYHQLRKQLHVLGLRATDVFLLHDAFYDKSGRALKPALGPRSP